MPKRKTEDPVLALERKLDALESRIDDLVPRPLGERVLAQKPALLGADPAGQLIEQWKSIRDRAASGASIAGQYLGRVIKSPWAGAALFSAALALLHLSVPYLLVSMALMTASVTSATSTPPTPEKSPPA